MRMLLSCVPAVSHANRLLPVIRAAVAAGHQVAVAASARVAARVALPGVRHYPAGLPAFPELGITDQARRHEWLYGTVLPELIGRFYPDLVRAIEDFHPDVLVHDFTEQAAGFAAAVFDLPRVSVAQGSTHPLLETYLDASRARNLRAVPAFRLPDGADAVTPREPVLHLCQHPPAFHGAGAAFPAAARFFRHENDGAADRALVGDVLTRVDPGLPLVMITVGTVVAASYRDELARLTDPLCDDRLAVVVLVGGPGYAVHELAENRLVVIDGPQQALLGYADLVVSSGGFNSIVETIAAGVPQVVGPVQLDGHYAAERCEELGLAAVVNLAGATAGTVRAAVRTVLAEPAYRRNALRLARENGRLPGISAALREIETLLAA